MDLSGDVRKSGLRLLKKRAGLRVDTTEKPHITFWGLERLVLKDPFETASTKPPKGHELKPRKVLREFREGLFTHSSRYVQRWQKELKLQPAQKLIGLLEGTGI